MYPRRVSANTISDSLATTVTPVQPASADRLRDYQDRLRQLEAQAMRDAQPVATPGVQPVPYDDPQPPPPQDPIAADRKRREYESLFASNVVLSRRPDNERPDVGRDTSQSNASARSDATSPSVDEVADALVRASTRTAGLTATSPPVPAPAALPAPQVGPNDRSKTTSDQTPSITAAGPLHRVLEGTVIETGLTKSFGWLERVAGELSAGGASSRRNEARPGVWRNAAGRVLPSSSDAGRPHVPSRPVPWAHSDRRRGPPGPSEPSLLVHVRSRGRGRTDQRTVPVPRKCWSGQRRWRPGHRHRRRRR
jgi:hypothetical protein